MTQDNPSAPAALAELERMRHIANEWADMATNGLQWLRNIQGGISTLDAAIANMDLNMKHCREVNDAPSPPAPAEAVDHNMEGALAGHQPGPLALRLRRPARARTAERQLHRTTETTPMSNAESICREMRNINRCMGMPDGAVIINTHCLYPNNGAVQAVIRGAASGFIVSDDGGAIREALTAGAELSKAAMARLGAIAAKHGLSFYKGIVSAPTVAIDRIPAAVMLVANVSKEIADHVFATHRMKPTRDFKAAPSPADALSPRQLEVLRKHASDGTCESVLRDLGMESI